MDIVVDFDGTCVTHEFPLIGKEVGAVPVLQDLVKQGHNLILFTMRSGLYLAEAVEWFKKNDIRLYGIQTNPTQYKWTSSPKAYGQLHIDDASIGCPLVREKDTRPYVDWVKVKELLMEEEILKY
jgi:hypothetical protein